MYDDRQKLLRVVRTVRNRWRLKVALRGLALTILVAAAFVLAAGYAIDASRFDPATVSAVRWLAYLVLLAVAWRFLLRPLLRRVSDERVALYLEENEPTLNGRLLAAVELGREEPGGLSPALFERLVRSAVEHCRRIDDGRRVERRRLWRSSGFLAGSGAFCFALFLVGPAFLHNTTPLLLRPWESSGARNPYAILVDPGNTVVARGADLKVVARLQNFDAADVELVVGSGDGDWRRWSMLREDDPSLHTLMLFDLREATEYFVDSSGVSSPVYRIEVVELPYVEEIGLVFHFPAYTELDPVEQPGSGDIAALVGTRVDLTVEPTIPVPGGAIELASGEVLPLVVCEDGKLSGSITVGEPDRYRILLDGAQGRRAASPDYVIDPLQDQPPVLRLARPGRDLRVTRLEEVTAEVKAQDDYGLHRLELVYSVNGGGEEAAVLYEGRPGRKDFVGLHTLYLEEWELQPGDLVSYHARARDGAGGETVSDLYFLQIRPFERNYRQADQGGMPGQGGMNGSELAEQQRMIVAATFKVLRDRERSGEKAFLGDLATVALSQGRLREQVEQIVEKLKAHDLPTDESPVATMAVLLPLAAEQMSAAEERLGENRPDLALGPEQKALQHLQRVEALFRDIQVARGQPGGGGAGGSMRDEIADLFELEMDRLKNQYEQVQRGDQERTDEAVDETLEKLRELARRQQQENERMRARSRQDAGQQAGSSGDSQRQLAEEAEEVARRLERLAREKSMPELAATARRLREAAEQMRRAASEREGESLGATALEQLRQARRELERNRSGRLERDTQKALETTRRLRRQQESMVDRVERLGGDGAERDAALQDIFEAKERMGSEVETLERDLDEMSRQAARDQPEASRRLQEAARGMRDEKIRDKILYSRGVVLQRSKEYALNFEEHIAETLSQLEERLEEAAGAIGESREERLGRALEETREVVTALESVEERLRAGAEGEGSVRPRDLRQLGRELQERRLQLERLRDELRREEVDAADLERIVGALRGLGAGEKLGDPGAAAVLGRDVVQGLKEFEYNLRRSLGAGEDERFLRVSDEDVPEGYEEMVDRYYKALAEGKR